MIRTTDHWIDNLYYPLKNIPVKNSTDNLNIRDVIGNKTDTMVSGKSLVSLFDGMQQFGAQKVYPSLAAGISSTTGNGVWTLPATRTTIVAANTIAFPIIIIGFCLEAIGTAETYETVLWTGTAGSEVEIARTRLRRLAYNTIGIAEINTPIIPANTRISVSAASDTANHTYSVSIKYLVVS